MIPAFCVKRRAMVAFAVALLVLSAASVLADLTLGTTVRISNTSGGGPANGDSTTPAQSANGKFLAFASDASDFDPNDSNGRLSDIFVKDLDKGTFFPVSVNEDGTYGNAASRSPAVSPIAPNGFYAVAFESSASNLMKSFNDTNGEQDIYVRFPTLNKTLLVSVDINGTQANGSSYSPSVALTENPDQVVIAFSSDASNLVPSDTNAKRDLFVVTIPVSAITSANPFAQYTWESSTNPQRTPDGDSDSLELNASNIKGAFVSTATNFIEDQPITGHQVYLFNRGSAAVGLVSAAADGTPGNGTSHSPSISFTGRYVAFITNSSNLTEDNTAGLNIVLRADTEAGTLERVDVTNAGVVGNGDALDCSISPNGRFVAFSSQSTSLSEVDENGTTPDVFVKDLVTGDLTKVSLSTSGASANGFSRYPIFIPSSFNALDGNVSFASTATDLVVDTPSGNSDIYSVTLTAEAPPFRRGAKIEVPPDVEIVESGQDRFNVTLSLQDFALPGASVQELSTAAAGRRIVYDVRLRSTTGRRRDNRAKLTRRNEVAFRKLKPGSYSARYRAMVKEGNRVVSRTRFSPSRRFSAESAENS